MSDTAYDPWGFDEVVVPATRAPRTLETRQHSERPRVWQPSSMLPDPIPQDGWTFKWCRTEIRNESDDRTYQKRLREGWEAVQAEDHPEMMSQAGLRQKSGLVEVGGLILCKMPTEMVEQRREYYANLTRAKTDAAEDNYMRDDDERMKKVAEKRRQVVFGQKAR